MEKYEHKAGRCNFLPRSPGFLDSLYNIWVQASEAVLGPKKTEPVQEYPYKVEAPVESYDHK